ncbi:RNA polymerase ADP-ribosylase [Escherichia phage BW-1]|nr:RNA polymerase ADP-ribosylase [Escherichia phage BW-1]
MIDILENLIAIEESGQTDDDKLNKLYDNLCMVDYEREFLLPINSELTVKSIYFDSKKNMHIIEMV